MPHTSLSIEQVLTLLAETPSRIAELTAGLTPVQLQTAPAPGEWSSNQVLAHLRACSDMWSSAMIEIINRDHPTLRAINPRTWINKTDYREQAFRPLLHAFTAQRTDLLAILEPLPPKGWSRAATVTGAGKPLEQTVLSYGRRLAVHERPHVKQIDRIASTLRA